MCLNLIGCTAQNQIILNRKFKLHYSACKGNGKVKPTSTIHRNDPQERAIVKLVDDFLEADQTK